MSEKQYFSITSLLILLLGISCQSDPSLSFEIPEEGFQVVQHLPKESKERQNNVLYLTPRPIKVKEFDSPELNRFIDSMYAVMLRTAGVGIAANQLGKRLQIFMIEAKVDNPRYQVLGPVEKQIFINPIITKVSEKRKNFWHGCLSAKGEKRGNVATFEWIEYECMNPDGSLRKGRLEGFGAVIFQHEYRHLMKGTYMDRANHFEERSALNQKIDSGELPFFEYAKDTLPLLIKGYELGKKLEDY
ncbi:MAG: peptide deformylase [Flavobacteriaceae bacterium]|nr:peptide deformylase [Flavobacteriaceae bacterium]|tara:strand:+ start:173794 stop:174528 length:735 start_codon:yes stop_codon:yes gene_type:complete